MEDISLIIRRIKRSGEPRLNLSGKQLISIPQEIYQLNLQYLDLSNNKITSIEPKLTTLTQLKVIDLTNNCIEEVPEDLQNMNQLQQLILVGNPLSARFQQLLNNSTQPQLGQALSRIFQNGPVSPITQVVTELKIQKPKLQPSLIQQVSQGSQVKMEVDATEFEVGDIISQGGFSLVHKGVLRGTEIAIKKIFNPNITQQLLDEINNEIDMLSYLRHPNIVLLMAVCTKPPNLMIATEYVSNGSLFQLLHKSNVQISDQFKISIALQIAKALNYMHQSGIVHRDIKSHNILLQGQIVKLCDFGLARRSSELNQGYSQFSGTPTYMAPELFAKRAYDKGVDLFAFGTLLWEIFAREVPFDGLDLQDIMSKVMKNEQLSGKNIPPKIYQLICDLRQKDDKLRPIMIEVIKRI